MENEWLTASHSKVQLKVKRRVVSHTTLKYIYIYIYMGSLITCLYFLEICVNEKVYKNTYNVV